MIYYFSGTGNSLYVAEHIAEALGEELCPMTSPVPTDDSVIGLVFPVYAWGIPNVVERFVRKHRDSCLAAGAKKGGYLYAVMTCGDDMGYADRVLEKELGRELDAAFSVLMPDVYICLPGFDVDGEEECREKFTMEKKTVKDIVACISERKSLRCLKRGPFPWLKSYAIRPLFNRYLVTDKYFNVDSSRCISCGKCIKTCPVGNIVMKDDLPQWQSDCSGCLACYHACPHHAINFGKMTQKKGQYTLPKDL